MPSWWGWQTAGVRDRATSHLPALLYERLDEIGIDFTILYPSMALGYFEIGDEELSSVLCRAVNRYHQRLFEPYRDRCTVGALIPMNTPAQAVAEVEYAVTELGAKSVLMAGYARRPVAAGGYRLDMFGIDSDHDYDPLWAKCVELGVAPVVHSALQQHRVTRSISNYVYNHVNGLAAAHESLCKSLFLAGVTRRFPELRIGFLEGGVAWACALFSSLVGSLGEAQPRRDRRARSRPARRRRAARVLHRVRRRRGRRVVSTSCGSTSPAPRRVRRRSTSSPRSASTPVDDLRARFEPNFYFGCEADDPLVAWAFRDDVNPLGARLRPVLGSDISHWDVRDMTEPVAEAYRARGARRDHRPRLPRPHLRQPGPAARRPQPALLRGHGVRSRRHPGVGRRRGGLAVNRDDARPLRSVVFAPGDDADALASTRASGADSMVVDLEEPQTPYPESERERGRKVAREFFDSLVPGELPLVFARVQPPSTGQTLKDLRAVAGPGLAGVLLPKIESPADVHMLDALLTCTEVDFDLPPGQLAIYPILETAQAIRLAYEIAIASPRVSHMGGALSRFGDIHQALGYRWTAEGEETLFLRSKVLVDAKAAGIRYPISGMWGGALDDLDGLRAFATGLRNLGYYGMMLGSAEHVPLVHEVFTPTAEEIAYWRELDELAAEAERVTAGRSATVIRARARPTSCTSPTSAPPARTSPGPATSASSDPVSHVHASAGANTRRSRRRSGRARRRGARGSSSGGGAGR